LRSTGGLHVHVHLWGVRLLLHRSLHLDVTANLCLGTEKLVNVVDLLLEEFLFSNESVKVLDSVKKTTGNFSSKFSVNILNGEENRVSDELCFVFSGSKLFEFYKVHLWEANGLELLFRLLLLSRNHRREVCTAHDGCRRLVLILILISTLVSVVLVVLAATSLVLVSSSTTLVTSVHISTVVLVTTVVVLVLIVVHEAFYHLLCNLRLITNDPSSFSSDLSFKIVNFIHIFIVLVVCSH
jgi:hypothetical protein